MKKYHIWADAVPEKEIIVTSESEAIAWFAYFTALTNVRECLDADTAYMDYHHRNKEDLGLSFEEWADGCDMIYFEVIEDE